MHTSQVDQDCVCAPSGLLVRVHYTYNSPVLLVYSKFTIDQILLEKGMIVHVTHQHVLLVLLLHIKSLPDLTSRYILVVIFHWPGLFAYSYSLLSVR